MAGQWLFAAGSTEVGVAGRAVERGRTARVFEPCGDWLKYHQSDSEEKKWQAIVRQVAVLRVSAQRGRQLPVRVARAG
jgi:hypothetical protein